MNFVYSLLLKITDDCDRISTRNIKPLPIRTQIKMENNKDILNNSLFEAIEKNIDIYHIAQLLEEGADPNSKDKFGSTPLMIVSWWGNDDTVQLFLSDPRIKINLKDNRKQTALFASSLQCNNRVKFNQIFD